MRNEQPQRQPALMVAHQQDCRRKAFVPRFCIVRRRRHQNAVQQGQEPDFLPSTEPFRNGQSKHWSWHRRVKPRSAKVQGQCQWFAKVQRLCPLLQARPRLRRSHKLTKQAVQVDQVPEPVPQFRVVEQMGRTVKNLVFGVQHLPALQSTGLQTCQKLMDVDLDMANRWQDVVVKVKLHPNHRVLHRWHLVAPIAVVPLVMRVQFRLAPTRRDQPGLCIGESMQWHEDVDV